MLTRATLDRWLVKPAESEQLEFKEAKTQFDTTKLLQYCAALANEGGGHLVLGVTNKPPRRVVGTRAFPSETALNDVKHRIVGKLHLRVDVSELEHPDGRVLVFEIPGRPVGQAVACDGVYLMRAGEALTAMTPDMLKRLAAEALICRTAEGWTITNLAAILLAKRLADFSPALARKAPRVVLYNGASKLKTRVYPDAPHAHLRVEGQRDRQSRRRRGAVPVAGPGLPGRHATHHCCTLRPSGIRRHGEVGSNPGATRPGTRAICRSGRDRA